MAAFDYDLFVIGAGSGGVRAARIAAGYGARVAIAEEHRIGGTCVIRGCVPKKLLVYASRFRDEFEDAAGYGWNVGETAFDWPTLIAAKDREVARLEAAYRRNLEAAGVEIIAARGELRGPHTVHLAGPGRDVTARTILIATGGQPNLDRQLPGIEHVITSNEAFHLERLPESIVIAGGGYIAVEFAGIFNGLGARTTLIYRGEEILRGFDDDLRTGLHAAMTARGIEVICGDVFSRIEKTDTGLVGHTRQGRALAAEQIMFAIGRSPRVEGLGLDRVGVAQGWNGAIVVDGTGRTSVDSIYAVGDVTDRVNLTPVAIREGHAFADIVFGGKSAAMSYDAIATAVFSTPEIGTVGLSEAEARERCRALDIYVARFRPMKQTMTGRDEPAMMKLVVDAQSDVVVGCHLLGPDAGELIQIVGILVKLGATKAQFDATVAVHPTMAEELVTLRTPARRWRAEDPATERARTAT
ncbi:NADPH-glutathione reductase [Tepidamorphus gemmatus]|uniref:Glutathione reductase n=1 Tax=Tepidamorphus gemmatus TaxID=747076 RepID=A0A4R3ME37_9HYPH|nr:glutathione-disulfide reductase [Tepidamorphus gemmatus]TCT11736.1 NADPH-glutathione reductase [Tepidamorphus gemmatus]